MSCCNSSNSSKNQTSLTGYKKIINNLKSSIFCGIKGFLTFNLAFLSYLEYTIHEHTFQKRNIQQGENRPKVKIAIAQLNSGGIDEVEEIEKKHNIYKFLKKGADFTIKRNTLPFLEMMIIIPAVCCMLPSSVGLVGSALICIALMTTACFIIRTFGLREKFLEKTTKDAEEEIKNTLKKDDIIYPIFSEKNKYIRYNFPGRKETSSTSTPLRTFLTFPIRLVQSSILLLLAVVEFLEAAPSFFVDLMFDRSFKSTKSNFKRSGHLLYASARNIVPLSRFDEPVAELIGAPEVACCGA
ncbi:hypothetical protein [Wolbachia endosymbiont of Pentidionis agamae]|uniref:hypothetical protein n=1 Tax=Wolbachia endosymbiont of Pentidionis agamae TaxID=3110435 RepID=UPI002FCF53F2